MILLEAMSNLAPPKKVTTNHKTLVKTKRTTPSHALPETVLAQDPRLAQRLMNWRKNSSLRELVARIAAGSRAVYLQGS